MQDPGLYDDLTKYDVFKAYLNYAVMTAKIYIDFFRMLRKKYRNYLSVGYHLKKRHFPMIGILKDGNKREYFRQEEVWFDLLNLYYDTAKDFIMINDMKFKGGVTNGDFISIFMNKDYESLPLKERIIIDIGSNIGDSSVFFVNRGAKKVFAIEPNKSLHELAKENVRLNSMTDRIETIFAGCSSMTSRNTIPPFLSLEELVSDYNIVPDFLKLDCEGCEYDIILNSSDSLLRRFNYILIEYHYGYKRITKKLQECGFRIKVSGPTYHPQINKPNNLGTKFSLSSSKVETNILVNPFIGYVYATRTIF